MFSIPQVNSSVAEVLTPPPLIVSRLQKGKVKGRRLTGKGRIGLEQEQKEGEEGKERNCLTVE